MGGGRTVVLRRRAQEAVRRQPARRPPRRRIDKPDSLDITLITRPPSEENGDGDGGLDLKFYAGPVKVPARGKCIQWWGSTTQKHHKFNTTVDLYSGFRSRWVHCN